MKGFRFLFIFTVFFLCSCIIEPYEADNTEYLIFGHFYGECRGEGCVEIFKLEKNVISEDENDTYPGSTDFYNAKWKNLDQVQFEKVKDLMSYFPDDLLNENQVVIGQPDAGDWGGIYIEIKSENVHKFWLIDKMRSNVPSKYHAFLDKVEEKISQLQTLPE